MKYSILRGWVREQNAEQHKIKQVLAGKEQLHLVTDDGNDLVLLTGARDAYPFWTTAGAWEDSAQPIWRELVNSSLQEATIDPQDRIVRFRFERTDVYQDRRQYLVICEFTPPRPNLILAILDERLTVLDAWHKYTLADNPRRQILPGQPYEAPKTGFQPDREEILPPLTLLSQGGQETISCGSFNDYLAAHYRHVILRQQETERLDASRRRWEQELKKARNKLRKQEAELAEAGQLRHWQICAETLKQHLHEIRPGQPSLIATNYFDPLLGSLELPLDPAKSARENLQQYWKRYQKAKRGKDVIAAKVEETRLGITHLEKILARIAQGEDVPPPTAQSVAYLGRKLQLADRLLRLRLSDEFEIVIGRKASENDFITTQLAQPHDWWFHSRIYRGAHILLRCLRKTQPGEILIGLCGSLAAWYSKARFSGNVPVDYTEARYVRKPRKSAPGFVTYTKHNTMFAEPKDLRAVRELLGR